jgi:hypothetical protein
VEPALPKIQLFPVLTRSLRVRRVPTRSVETITHASVMDGPWRILVVIKNNTSEDRARIPAVTAIRSDYERALTPLD